MWKPTENTTNICIFILAVEWILFGSMHFSDPGATKAQLPNFFPYKSEIVLITGIFEVITGTLILLRQTRKYAAFASGALLVLLSPAMVKILYVESSVPYDAIRPIFVTLIIPNSILLMLCSIQLFWHPHSTAKEQSGHYPENSIKKSLYNNKSTVLVAILLLMANIAGLLAIFGSGISDKSTANLWAIMCISVGALIGFIFAVPRVNPNFEHESAFLTNSNIEQVSDWMTKILVGVGLINFKDILSFVDQRALELAIVFQSQSANPNVNFKPFAIALILYFFVVGLIQGYLLTRLFLAGRFNSEAVKRARKSQISKTKSEGLKSDQQFPWRSFEAK